MSLAAVPSRAAKVVVCITGLSEPLGQVGCSLFAVAAGFPMDNSGARVLWQPADIKGVVCRYADVPEGSLTATDEHLARCAEVIKPFGRFGLIDDPVTHFGVTPVWRWYPQGQSDRWFLEAGIGANLLAPVYRNRDKRFSTTFNFGDHLAVGWYFGPQRRHELALRLQHFSNAGIKQPNPGEDSVQLRYLARF